MIANFSNWGNELLEAVLFLLGEGAEVNVQSKVRWISWSLFNWWFLRQWEMTPLYWAYKQPEISQILIEHGAKVDTAQNVRYWWLDEIGWWYDIFKFL